MATAYLSRTVLFSAWHRYFRAEWSREQNEAAFGAAAREPAHGHDYRCTVTVRGPVYPDTGMVIDLGLLDRVLREEVVDRLGGRRLNDVAGFGPHGTVPTGESVCIDLWARIGARLPAGCRLHAVRVAEDETLFSEYRGEP